jgi:hypothetical protein
MARRLFTEDKLRLSVVGPVKKDEDLLGLLKI